MASNDQIVGTGKYIDTKKAPKEQQIISGKTEAEKAPKEQRIISSEADTECMNQINRMNDSVNIALRNFADALSKLDPLDIPFNETDDTSETDSDDKPNSHRVMTQHEKEKERERAKERAKERERTQQLKIFQPNVPSRTISSFSEPLVRKVHRPPKPKKKSCNTLFWGIALDKEKIKKHRPIELALKANPELMILNDMHTILLYVGKSSSIAEEEKFEPHRNKMCGITIDGHGVSSKALALSVKKMYFIFDLLPVPSYANKQFVTVALAPMIKSAEAVKVFEKDKGTIVGYSGDDQLTLVGQLIKY
jgi:hypothetical protein